VARLARSDRAIVPEAKIVDYLLSARHPVGRAKARFLAGFGFNVENWHALRDAIVADAMANEITASHRTQFGIKFEIDGPLLAPDGRASFVRVIWFTEAGEDVPQLVTLVPRRIKSL
jgi:hypothetical protein